MPWSSAAALVQILEAAPATGPAQAARGFMAEIRAAHGRRPARGGLAHPMARGGKTMSWLDKLLPPKIQQTDPSERRTVPEGLWIKCPSCETVLYQHRPGAATLNVCPKCAHHHRIGARARLDAFLDAEGRYEIGQEVLPVDALKFKRQHASTRSA
jgi:hypothetical protein